MANHAGRTILLEVIARLKNLETVSLAQDPFEDTAIAISADQFPAIAVEPEEESVAVRSHGRTPLVREETRTLAVSVTAIDKTREKVDLLRLEIEKTIAAPLIGTDRSLERTDFDATGGTVRLYAARLHYSFEYHTNSVDPSTEE